MSKLFQVYGIGQALIPVLPPPLAFENAPTSNQTNYEIGQVVYTPPKAPTAFYFYAGSGSWVEIVSGSGAITSVLGTTNQVTVTTVAGVATISIPSTFVAPGSIAATTTVTATLGNITATNGNLVASTAGNGVILPVATGSGAASGAVTCNGRQGSVSFTSPSIAGGAVLTLTMTNSSITGSGTVILYTVRGATTGASLCIQSVTNSAGSSAVVMNNGTGATTQTGTITLDFIVLN